MAIDPGCRVGSECVMRNRDRDIDQDAKRLDKAIEHVLGILDQVVPVLSDPEDATVLEVAVARAKLDACKALVPLLERRAALLGLDAPTGKNASDAQPSGSLAELEKKLALVK